jgi:hypothetical protein
VRTLFTSGMRLPLSTQFPAEELFQTSCKAWLSSHPATLDINDP